jgi:hypothetical protein
MSASCRAHSSSQPAYEGSKRKVTLEGVLILLTKPALKIMPPMIVKRKVMRLEVSSAARSTVWRHKLLSVTHGPAMN